MQKCICTLHCFIQAVHTKLNEFTEKYVTKINFEDIYAFIEGVQQKKVADLSQPNQWLTHEQI